MKKEDLIKGNWYKGSIDDLWVFKFDYNSGNKIYHSLATTFPHDPDYMSSDGFCCISRDGYLYDYDFIDIVQAEEKLVKECFPEETNINIRIKNDENNTFNSGNSNFDNIIQSRIDTTKDLLLVKGKEYIRNNDKLWNFHKGAKIKNIPATEVLDGMLLKHYISYQDILQDVKENKEISLSQVKEKIGDIIVYFHLQECLLTEYINEHNKNSYKSVFKR